MSSPVTIVGNLTRDPELKFINSGSATVRFSVAVTKKGWQDKPDIVSFFNCNAIGDIASNIANSLHKGNRVVVYGALRHRTWDKPDGTKGEATEIEVEAVGPDLRFNTVAIENHIAKPQSKPQPRIVMQEEAF
jgi:single-strand DNA-binding protein